MNKDRDDVLMELTKRVDAHVATIEATLDAYDAAVASAAYASAAYAGQAASAAIALAAKEKSDE